MRTNVYAWGSNTTSFRALAATTMIAAAALALSGCGGAGPAKDSPSAITIGLIPVADAGGYFAAKDQGFFGKHNIEVKEESIAGGSALLPALESNSMQIGFSNITSVLQAADSGLDVTCLTGTVKRNDDTTMLIARKNADKIKSAKDLEGKLVAVSTIGNVNDMLAKNWVDSMGGDSTKVKFVATGFPDMPAALENGTVDAAVVFEPSTTVARNSGITEVPGKTVLDVLDNPTAAFSCWVVTKTWLDGHETEAKAFVAALKDADTYLSEDPERLRALLVKDMKVKEDLAEKVVLPTISTALTEDDVRQWETIARKYGIVKNPIDISSLVSQYK
jgi:NitT/TauT family transport system substrate-binding protein